MELSNLTSNDSHVTTRCSTFTAAECDALIEIKFVTAVISMIITLIALILALILNNYKILAERIVLMIIVTDWLDNMMKLSHDGEISISCKAVGYFSEVFDLMTIFAFIALTIFILLRIRYNKDTARYQCVYAAIIIIPAIIIAFIPLEVYGPAGAWCWIVATAEGHIYRMMLYWFPMVISSICVSVIFIYLYIYTKTLTLRYSGSDEQSKVMKRNQERLVDQYLKPYVGIGIAYLILQTVMFANRLNDWVTGKGNFGLYVVHTIGSSIIGVIYSALMFTTNTWTEFRSWNIREGIRRLKDDILSSFKKNDKRLSSQDDIVETVPGPVNTSIFCSSARSLLRGSSRKMPQNPLPTITSGGSMEDTNSSPVPSNSTPTVSDQMNNHSSDPVHKNSEFDSVNDAYDLESITLSEIEEGPTPNPPARRAKSSNGIVV